MVRFDVELLFDVYSVLPDSWKPNVFIKVSDENRLVVRIYLLVIEIDDVSKEV